MEKSDGNKTSIWLRPRAAGLLSAYRESGGARAGDAAIGEILRAAGSPGESCPTTEEAASAVRLADRERIRLEDCSARISINKKDISILIRALAREKRAGPSVAVSDSIVSFLACRDLIAKESR